MHGHGRPVLACKVATWCGSVLDGVFGRARLEQPVVFDNPVECQALAPYFMAEPAQDPCFMRFIVLPVLNLPRSVMLTTKCAGEN